MHGVADQPAEVQLLRRCTYAGRPLGEGDTLLCHFGEKVQVLVGVPTRKLEHKLGGDLQNPRIGRGLDAAKIAIVKS